MIAAGVQAITCLATKIFAEMIDSAIKPAEYSLVMMVKLHGHRGTYDEAHDLVANWEAVVPSLLCCTFTCLMGGCLRTKNYDRAWVAYELMCENGLRRDETTVATLLPGMGIAQPWEICLLLIDAHGDERGGPISNVNFIDIDVEDVISFVNLIDRRRAVREC